MGEASGTKADWYPDPHGGSGVRWWDGSNDAPDSYLLDLFHGAPEGALATTCAALVPLYDQVFRTVTPVRAPSDLGLPG